jgi:hypothetical protein
MLNARFDATTSGYPLGYGTAVPFTCEYKLLFGALPMRDLKQRQLATTESPAEF